MPPPPAQDVARRILEEDVTQIDTYTERVKRMVGWISFNGITRYGNGATSLIGGDELSDCVTWPKTSVAEPLRDELLQLFRQRLDGFRAQRGEEVFAHRSRHRTPISGSVKYRVLTTGPGAAASAAALTSISALWRWTTSSRRTRAAPTTSTW